VAARESTSDEPAVLQLPAENAITEYRRRPQRKLSLEQQAELVAAYKTGATTYDLAEQFSLHRTTVSKLIAAAGHKVRGTGLLPHEIPDVVHRYQAGESMTSLARVFDVSKANVKKHLLEAGTRLRDTPH